MDEKKTPIFNGRIVSLAVEEHRLPDGRLADFEIVRHPGGAAVLPVLADGRVVLINQFRPAAGGMVLEIPAGRLEPGEVPEACIHRELQEEVGYRAGRLAKLGQMLTAVGFCDEVVHLYVATELLPVAMAPEPDEYIEVLTLSLAEALQMVREGRVSDGKTQLALLLFAGRRR
jgi:ADP-ribose pyrophosphatase